jgi:hypothetical protein
VQSPAEIDLEIAALGSAGILRLWMEIDDLHASSHGRMDRWWRWRSRLLLGPVGGVVPVDRGHPRRSEGCRLP